MRELGITITGVENSAMGCSPHTPRGRKGGRISLKSVVGGRDRKLRHWVIAGDGMGIQGREFAGANGLPGKQDILMGDTCSALRTREGTGRGPARDGRTRCQ